MLLIFSCKVRVHSTYAPCVDNINHECYYNVNRHTISSNINAWIIKLWNLTGEPTSYQLYIFITGYLVLTLSCKNEWHILLFLVSLISHLRFKQVVINAFQQITGKYYCSVSGIALMEKNHVVYYVIDSIITRLLLQGSLL